MSPDNYLRKLSVEQVKEIRKLYRRGEKQAYLSSVYGVSQSSISRIIRRMSWRAFA